MANLNVWASTWVDSGETGLQPGASHFWAMWGFGFTDVVAITPAGLNSDVGDQILQVTDVRYESDPSGGRRCFFTVQNVGPVRAIAYRLNFAFMSL